ncbi:hypothetical protein BH23THE1_BH23THE1_20450 [soil metagenome]
MVGFYRDTVASNIWTVLVKLHVCYCSSSTLIVSVTCPSIKVQSLLAIGCIKKYLRYLVEYLDSQAGD